MCTCGALAAALPQYTKSQHPPWQGHAPSPHGLHARQIAITLLNSLGGGIHSADRHTHGLQVSLQSSLVADIGESVGENQLGGILGIILMVRHRMASILGPCNNNINRRLACNSPRLHMAAAAHA